jgi:hypothetical protein
VWLPSSAAGIRDSAQAEGTARHLGVDCGFDGIGCELFEAFLVLRTSSPAFHHIANKTVRDAEKY